MTKKNELKVKEKQELAVHKDTSVNMLIGKAIDKNTSVEVYEKLMVMRRELKQEEAKELFDNAMARFQGSCPVIGKNKRGAVTKDDETAYFYATLADIVVQTKDLREENGFSFILKSQTKQGNIKAILIIKHAGGGSETTDIEVPLINKTGVMSMAQVVIGTINLAKRHAFCNGFGIMTADMDNDIVAASQKGMNGKIEAAKQKKAQNEPLNGEIVEPTGNGAETPEEPAQRKPAPIPDKNTGLTASGEKLVEVMKWKKQLPGDELDERNEFFKLLKETLNIGNVPDEEMTTEQCNKLIKIIKGQDGVTAPGDTPESESSKPSTSKDEPSGSTTATECPEGYCVDCFKTGTRKKVLKASAALSIKRCGVVLCGRCLKKRK